MDMLSLSLSVLRYVLCATQDSRGLLSASYDLALDERGFCEPQITPNTRKGIGCGYPASGMKWRFAAVLRYALCATQD